MSRLARIVGHATHSIHPSEFTTAPIGAMGKLADSLDWDLAEFLPVSLDAYRNRFLATEVHDDNEGEETVEALPESAE